MLRVAPSANCDESIGFRGALLSMVLSSVFPSGCQARNVASDATSDARRRRRTRASRTFNDLGPNKKGPPKRAALCVVVVSVG
jgi:hypothetical protein